jgi:hypothetical protein
VIDIFFIHYSFYNFSKHPISKCVAVNQPPFWLPGTCEPIQKVADDRDFVRSTIGIHKHIQNNIMTYGSYDT